MTRTGHAPITAGSRQPATLQQSSCGRIYLTTLRLPEPSDLTAVAARALEPIGGHHA
jgi:hypothetical protein